MPNILTPFGLVEVKNASGPVSLFPQMRPAYAARGAADGVTGPVPVGASGVARSGTPLDANLLRASGAMQTEEFAKATKPLFDAGVFLATAPLHPFMLAASLFQPTEEQQRLQGIQARKDSHEDTRLRHRGGE